MAELSLDNVKTFLEKEGDWTIRLLNKNLPSPKKYIFGLLRFDGNKNTWTVRFLQQNRTVNYENDRKSFLEAKQLLIEEIPTYLRNGYNITVLVSGYEIPPWLQRKR